MARDRLAVSYAPRYVTPPPPLRWLGPFEGFQPVDAVLFGLFFLDRAVLGPLPIGVGLSAFIVAVALLRRPRLRVPALLPLGILGVTLLGYLGFLSHYSNISGAAGVDWTQRWVRIALLFVLLWAVASGRFHLRSAVIGLVAGLGINAAAYYLRLTPDNYPPHLTGWLADKNVAGLWYAAVAMLALMLCRTRWQALVWITVSAGVLFLTGSRTSMTGFAVGVLWWMVRNRLALPLRLAFAGIVIAVIQVVEVNYARVGIFADREGTDWLRNRVEHLMAEKVALTPWHGLGLTESFVWYSPTRWLYFHDSFAALYVEGGLPLLGFMMIAVLLVAGGLLMSRRATPEMKATEAAVAVLLVCAWKLGEVFFTTIAILTVAMAIAAHRGVLRHKSMRPLDTAAPRRGVDEEGSA